jgi:hypothetical protein
MYIMAKLIFELHNPPNAEEPPSPDLAPGINYEQMTPEQQSEFSLGLRKGSMTDPRITEAEARRMGIKHLDPLLKLDPVKR